MSNQIHERAAEAAYRAAHWAIALPLALLKRAAAWSGQHQLASPDDLAALTARYEQLLDTDLANVREGLYPRRLLFSAPVVDYARALPSLMADTPRRIRRASENRWREVPGDAASYPPYYQRTFHWQTDGYFSRRSAELYDIGVELLFSGTGDVMRRQVIPPLTRAFAAMGGAAGKRLLDVACGTGRTLAQVAQAHPGLKLYGLDLSPAYVAHARHALAHIEHLALMTENAEAIPFADETFDAVTNVYLLHELPRPVRRKVVREMRRVLAPGGALVIEDSAQLRESADLTFFLERFAEEFHEPYYPDYLNDPLEDLLAECGMEVTETSSCFLSKVVVARRH